MEHVMRRSTREREREAGTARRADIRDVAVATVMSHPVLAVPATASDAAGAA